MPAPASYARESDCKDTLKCINFNVLAHIFFKKYFFDIIFVGAESLSGGCML